MRPAVTTGIIALALALALALTTAACGQVGNDVASSASTSTTAPLDRPSEPVDDVFDVDGVRFHLHCTGSGDTTVVLIAGWGAAGDESWFSVQRPLATQARTCTYDRPGTGTSDEPPRDQTFGSQAADLKTLLEIAGEPGPYVVVGHSFGGVQAVTFASQHEREVVGLVLVDASPTTWPAAVCAVPADRTDASNSFRELCEVMHDPSRDPERLDVMPAFEQAATITSLGDLPLTVITAATRTAPGLPATQIARLNEVWDTGVRSWAALSGAAKVVTVTDTGHNIQLDHPDLVLREVIALLH